MDLSKQRVTEQFHGEGRAITVPLLRVGAGKVSRAFYQVDRCQFARPSCGLEGRT